MVLSPVSLPDAPVEIGPGSSERGAKIVAWLGGMLSGPS